MFIFNYLSHFELDCRFEKNLQKWKMNSEDVKFHFKDKHFRNFHDLLRKRSKKRINKLYVFNFEKFNETRKILFLINLSNGEKVSSVTNIWPLKIFYSNLKNVIVSLSFDLSFLENDLKKFKWNLENYER